jgi:hypothetical protein
MSFLDNLENSLKAMESREERGGYRNRDEVRRDAELAEVKAAAPFAEQLRKGPFTPELLNEATRIGHGLRVKVYITWIDGVLRLEARERRLELKATPKGVLAQYFVNKEPAGSETVDLNGSAKKLAEKWLSALEARPGGQ